MYVVATVMDRSTKRRYSLTVLFIESAANYYCVTLLIFATGFYCAPHFANPHRGRNYI